MPSWLTVDAMPISCRAAVIPMLRTGVPPTSRIMMKYAGFEHDDECEYVLLGLSRVHIRADVYAQYL